MEFDASQHAHRRFNALTGDWILCSPHRAKRPWQGQLEVINSIQVPSYVNDCYLCPGNTRIDGSTKNPDYTSTFVFPNDFPAVLTSQPSFDSTSDSENKLFKSVGVKGVCKVICFSPKHNLTIAKMTTLEITEIIKTWINVYQTIALENPFIQYIQLFENKGSTMGCSNPHPHGQVWATEHIPQEPQKEMTCMTSYFHENKTCLLCDYVNEEMKKRDRIVYENAGFVVLVPYWALWPFETLVLPKVHVTRASELSNDLIKEFADALRNITCRYDNMFQCEFPYSMGIHQSPTSNTTTTHQVPFHSGMRMDCHLHVHFYPPLLRSATVKKFLVGFEMLGESQRDLTAEQAAERLRGSSDEHYDLKPLNQLPTS